MNIIFMILDALDLGCCPNMEDGQHCEHWWDCEPCHACGWDRGGENNCDCPRHRPELYAS